jgi:leucyl aminopeptidase
MQQIDVTVKPGRPEQEQAELLVLTHYEDADRLHGDAATVDRALGGILNQLLSSGEFTGKNQQTTVVHTHGKLPAKRVLLLGLGKKKDAKVETIRQAMGVAAKRAKAVNATSLTASIAGTDLSGVTDGMLAQAMVEGTILGSYQFTAYRSTSQDKKEKTFSRIILVVANAASLAAVKQGAAYGHAGAEAAVFVRDLCNHPSNVMTPSRVAEEAKQIAKSHRIKIKILERKDVEHLGMGAFLGVAKGSHEPPKFIILEYDGRKGARTNKKGTATGPIVLVGKTITFDTGGISLKPAENMEQMKADMTGGAEVLATIRAVAKLKLPVHLISILPATENMPGGSAIKPGDILMTLSGKTVEVQNTDAEGRLILADGLTYATRLKPSAIIDIATLTGACVVALGQFAIGMFGNDQALKDKVRQAGTSAGERVWEMPLWDEYFEQLKSDVADMRNIGGRGGGMITAALFLSKFVGDCKWVHLDIASTDWSERERAYIPKGPSGIGTRLLLQYVINEATA